jgi:methionyl-tRNA formyltransferase
MDNENASATRKSGLKLVFAGTPEFGLPALEALHASHHHLQAVYTQPDRPGGRGQQLQPSVIKQWGNKHSVPVFQPEHFKSSQAVDQLQALAPDVMVVIAYGLILPKSVLAIPRLGCVNVHASLLPAWRGASPIQSAILHGDQETGVTIMQMDAGMDTGDILSVVRVMLDSKETAGTLHDKLSLLSVKPLLETLDALQFGHVRSVPQAHDKATYTKKILKEDAWIDWSKPAESIERQIRAYLPWPVCYTFYGELRVRVFEAEIVDMSVLAFPGTILAVDEHGLLVATGENALRIQSLQFAGGRVLRVSEWLHGHSPVLAVGQCFK